LCGWSNAEFFIFKKLAMTQNQVTKMIANAISFANREGIEIAVAVVDNGGHLVAFMRTDNCSFAAIKVSDMKAKSACAFGMTTDAIGELVQANPVLKQAFDSFADIFYFGGGLPIISASKVVGGIGISGVNPLKDKEIAQYALSEVD
jgi:glc operon protein GlcG